MARIGRLALCLLALLLNLAASVALAQQAAGPAQPAAEPPQQPFLRVEAAAHTAPVARLAADVAGRTLASVSDDKTLRIWDLPEGTQRAVLRPPIAPEAEGELYAVALTPDGRRVFAAGWTGYGWDRAFAIYLYDTSSGRMLARLPGLPAPVQHLAISADGTRLAAALGGRAGIRVWNATNGSPLWQDTDFAGPARMVAFEPQGGRLAATGADGRVRVYEGSGSKVADATPLPNARPFGLAWSPDGGLLAVGFEDRLRVEVLAASDLHSVFTPDVSGLVGEGLPAVTWAQDGRGGVQLHASGYARRASTAPAAVAEGDAPRREFVIRRWSDYGLGPSVDIAAARDAISHLLPLAGGGLAYSAADPGWGLLAPDGTLSIAPQPPGADFRNTGAGLAVSADGTRVRVALRPGAPPLQFDALAGTLGTAPPDAAGFASARTEGGRLVVADWRNANRPRLGRTPLALGSGEFARSLALLPGDAGVLLGTDNHLRLYDARGRATASLQVPGTVWGLALAGDVAVGALGDGTIRWWRIGGNGIVEQAALFIHAATRRWVLWTPEGLFDHAPNGGQELVGLQLNGGRAQTPEWASFQQAYRALYAPAAVRARIAGDGAPARARLAQLGELRARVGRLPLLAPQSACAVTPEGCTPVTWDARNLPEGATALRLRFTATDRGLGLGPLDVLVNDRIAARAEPASTALAATDPATPRADPAIAMPAPGVGRGIALPGLLEAEVPLDPGGNRISTRLYAEDRTLFAEGPAMELRRPGGPLATTAGRLVILAIGINSYANASLNLNYAVPDAEAVAQALHNQAGSLFSAVQVTVLRDAQATRRGVLAALAEVARTTTPQDTFVLYLGGHGVRTEPDQRFLFLPHDTNDTSNWPALRRQGIEDSVLVAAIARIRARDGLLLLDTCHAGQLTMDQLSALGNETGRFLLAASTSVQEALDSYDDRNGVFAYAVLEALRGKAAADGEGRISALALGEWVMRRVPQLAAEKRHQQDAVFRTASRDLRSFSVAITPR